MGKSGPGPLVSYVGEEAMLLKYRVLQLRGLMRSVPLAHVIHDFIVIKITLTISSR